MADSLTGILSLLQAFSSKTGTSTISDSGSTTTSSGGSSTKQTVLSQDTLNAMLKSALEGSSGLADVVNAQNKSGLYNSTTNSMLTNDLLSRLATQVAVAGAPTTTTTTPDTKTTTPSTKTTQTTAPAAVSGTAAAGTLAGTLGLSAAKPILDKLLGAKKSAVSAAGEAVGNSASQSTSSIAAMNGEVNPNTVEYLNGTVAETGNVGADAIASEASAGATEPVLEAVQNTANEALGAVTDAVSNGIVSSIADSAGSAAVDAIGTTIGGSFVEYGGDAMAQAAADEAASVAADEATNIGGSFCFLTTAVCEYQQKPDNCPELETLRAFRDGWLKENHPNDITTYYAHAPAIVRKIKALPHAASVFDEMYYGFILPALRYIEAGKLDDAYRTYKQLYNFCVGV